MADIITRLKLDASQHDNALKKSKGNLQDYGRGASQLSNTMSQAVGAFTKYFGAISAGAATLKVAKDAFMQTEQGVDAWGRAVASADAAYQTFLGSINTGNWDGFINNIKSAIDEATKLYDIMDDLASYSARFNPYTQASAAQVQTLLKEAKALKAQGNVDAAKAKIAEARKIANDVDSATTIKGGKDVSTGLATLNSLMHDIGWNRNNEMSKAQAMEMINPNNWARLQEVSKQYTTTQGYKDEAARLQTKYQDMQIQGIKGDGLEKVRQEGLQAWNNYQSQIQKYGTLAYQEMVHFFQDLRDETDSERGKIFNTALSQMYGDVNAQSTKGMLNAQIDQAEARILGGGTTTKKDNSIKIDPKSLDIKESLMQSIMQSVEEINLDGKIPPINLEFEFDKSSIDYSGLIAAQGDQIRQKWNVAANAISEVGSALQQIDDPAAKVAGIMAQAIATMILSYTEAMQTAALVGGPWGWIAFAASGLATLIGTVSAVKNLNAGSYADGGIIGGSSYSGDRLIAHVNSGEAILNQRQIGNALSLMDNASTSGAIGGQPYVSGEMLVLGINNHLRRTGRGELVTTR